MAATGAGAAAGLAGCFGGGGGGGGGDTDPSELPPVHFLTDYNNEAWQAYWEEDLVPQFQNETDIDVRMEYSGFSGGGQEGRLATLLQSGDPPALSTGTMEQVADIWASDNLQPVTDVIEEIESVAGELSSPPYQDPNDDYWQISHGYYTSTFMYRTDVYEELGLEPPESFADIKENARIIDESDLDIRGYGLAGQKTGKAQDEYQVYLSRMGVSELKPKDPNAEKPESELWFPEEEMLTLLEFFDDLAQYSPDPAGIGWGGSIKGWLAGNYAQQYHLNTWPAGIAAGAGLTDIAENTDVVEVPVWSEGGITQDDVYANNPTPDGHFLYQGSDNPQGAREFTKWLYGDNLERTASMYKTEPTRFIPNYEDVLGSDAFKSIQLFQDHPDQYEKLAKVQNEIRPTSYGNVEEALVDTPESFYYYRFFFIAEMVNQVVVADEDPKAAYDAAKEKAQQRLREGKEKLR